MIKVKSLIFCGICLFFSCNTHETERKVRKPDHKKNEGKALSECIEKILYYDLEVDPEKYDSIGSYYFHEIYDYTEEEAIKAYDLLGQLKWIRNESIQNNYEIPVEGGIAAVEKKIDSLTQVLHKYKPEISGYIFLHSFYDGKDTSTRIFIIEKDFDGGIAIPVNAIKDVVPEAYASEVRSIRPKL
jgi:hypothetical protein